jgi:hypothetical protein
MPSALSPCARINCSEHIIRIGIIIIDNPNQSEVDSIVNYVIEYGLSQVKGVIPRKCAFHVNSRNADIIGGATGRA